MEQLFYSMQEMSTPLQKWNEKPLQMQLGGSSPSKKKDQVQKLYNPPLLITMNDRTTILLDARDVYTFTKMEEKPLQMQLGGSSPSKKKNQVQKLYNLLS